jgi:muramoyltetrapeptide carboxypeptidase
MDTGRTAQIWHYPPPLQSGDRLRVIAPSGALRELESFNRGVEVWRGWGFGSMLAPGAMTAGGT